MNKAWLVVTQWSFVMGGEHYSGRLYGKDCNGEDIDHEMSTGLAGRLNKKDGSDMNRPGDRTCRFETISSLFVAAKEKALERWPDLEILGRDSMASVTYIIWAKDKDLQAKLNKIYEETEAIYAVTNDPYTYEDGSLGVKVDKLFDEWFKLIRE